MSNRDTRLWHICDKTKYLNKISTLWLLGYNILMKREGVPRYRNKGFFLFYEHSPPNKVLKDISGQLGLMDYLSKKYLIIYVQKCIMNKLN